MSSRKIAGIIWRDEDGKQVAYLSRLEAMNRLGEDGKPMSQAVFDKIKDQLFPYQFNGKERKWYKLEEVDRLHSGTHSSPVKIKEEPTILQRLERIEHQLLLILDLLQRQRQQSPGRNTHDEPISEERPTDQGTSTPDPVGVSEYPKR